MTQQCLIQSANLRHLTWTLKILKKSISHFEDFEKIKKHFSKAKLSSTKSKVEDDSPKKMEKLSLELQTSCRQVTTSLML